MVIATDPDRPDLGGNVQGGDPNTWSPHLWEYLLDEFQPVTVLDVGCGEGHAVKWFTEAGVPTVGIDGLPANIANGVSANLLHDLTVAPFIMAAGLVWSAEVAEHISPEHVDKFLTTLANGDVIAMTHALPGQGGHYHVNEQPPEYWIGKIEALGYVTLDPTPFRKAAWLDGEHNYFARTGLVFERVR